MKKGGGVLGAIASFLKLIPKLIKVITGVIMGIKDIFLGFTKSGLYFQPPTTIINSKKIIELIIKPIGM